MNIVMVGTGYVGLASGLGFAKLGHRVVCVDIDASKIAKLELGEPTFFEPGVPETLKEMLEAGRIMFTTSLKDVVDEAQVVIIAVGTPPLPNGQADLSFVYKVAEDLGALLRHDCVVIVKSTVPVGTNRIVLEKIQRAMQEAGHDEATSRVRIGSVPEFLRPGYAMEDFFHPARIILGADDEETFSVLDRLHAGLEAPRVRMSIESAELTKYAANALLATKISFINEIANIADEVGADVREVAQGVGMDPRLGPHFLNAGIGFGGMCFPKDVSALHQIAGTKGYECKLLSAVIEVNSRQRERFLRKVEHDLNGFKGKRIALWGLAFKGGTDDVRGSISIDIAQRLAGRGADVYAFDPKAMDRAKAYLPENVKLCSTAVDACEGADALLVVTEWPEFREVSFEAVRERMIDPRIYDGRNLLTDLELEKKGFSYKGVGVCRPGRHS